MSAPAPAPAPAAAPASAPAALRAAARRRRLVVFGVLVLGLACSLGVSALTGPSFDEERRINAVRRALTLIRSVSTGGISALVAPSASSVYGELSPFGSALGLLSAWLGEVLRGAGVVDRLTGLRLGFVLLTGLAPLAVFLLAERSRGVLVGGLAVLLLIGTPRFTHALGTGREPAVVATLWLLLLAVYLRSLPPSLEERKQGRRGRHKTTAALFGVLFGAALATSRAVLGVLPILLVHHVMLGGRASLAELRRGRIAVPTAILWAVVLAGPVLLALEPRLWTGGGGGVPGWLFSSLGPAVEPLVYRGIAVVDKALPSFYSLDWLVETTPLPVLALVALSAFFAVQDRFFPGVSSSPAPDPLRVQLLSVLVVVAVALGPAVTPRVLSRFPGRAELALPFLAILAAIALERLARWVVGSARVPVAALATSALVLAAGLVGLPTAGASFNFLGGSTGGALSRNRFTVGDGSELAVLARSIDGARRARASVHAPDVPKSYFGLLNQVDRLTTKVEPARTGAASADLSVVRGSRTGAAAVSSHWGGAVWSLVRR